MATLSVWLKDAPVRQQAGSRSRAGDAAEDVLSGLGGFRPVVVRSASLTDAGAETRAAGTLVTPNGFRVEGLSLASLVSVLKELSC